jgi:hypothetical protein
VWSAFDRGSTVPPNAGREAAITMNNKLRTSLLVAGSAVAIALAAAPTSAASPGLTPTTPAPGPGGAVAMPPGGPLSVYWQSQNVGGADPYTPFGTDPSVPYGVWTQ